MLIMLGQKLVRVWVGEVFQMSGTTYHTHFLTIIYNLRWNCELINERHEKCIRSIFSIKVFEYKFILIRNLTVQICICQEVKN